VRARAPDATIVVAAEPPVLGAALAALDAARAPATAHVRLREAFRERIAPE